MVCGLRWVSIKVGFAGASICYFGDLFAHMAGAFYSNPFFFRGWEWCFIVWCSSFLDHHVSGYSFYVGGLCAVSVILSLLVRSIECHEVLDEADRMLGGVRSSKPSASHPAGHLLAGLLFLPFVPPLIGALAGVMILVLVAVLFAAYVLFCCLRYGGINYIWTRAAVRSGVRDALGRRPR